MRPGALRFVVVRRYDVCRLREILMSLAMSSPGVRPVEAHKSGASGYKELFKDHDQHAGRRRSDSQPVGSGSYSSRRTLERWLVQVTYPTTTPRGALDGKLGSDEPGQDALATMQAPLEHCRSGRAYGGYMVRYRVERRWKGSAKRPYARLICEHYVVERADGKADWCALLAVVLWGSGAASGDF